jgi:hypothetical protein
MTVTFLVGEDSKGQCLKRLDFAQPGVEVDNFRGKVIVSVFAIGPP